MMEGAEPPGVFFPDLAALKARSDGDELSAYLDALDALDQTSVVRELSFELLKVQNILDQDRRASRRGFMALKIELICVAIFLVSVAIGIIVP
jgi:hypothetical protein